MTEVELTISTKPNEPGTVRLVATLGIAGLLSGLILVFAFQFTAPIIAANKAKALREAVFKVVPTSTRLQEFKFVDGKFLDVVDKKSTKGEVIYAAYDDEGNFIGYAITGLGNGFQDTIKLLYGYDPTNRTVTGMHILDSKETPGLGDNIYKDPEFVEQFNHILVDPTIELIKGDAVSDNQIDAITGATISSKAVVKIINVAHSVWDERTKGPPPSYTNHEEVNETGGEQE